MLLLEVKEEFEEEESEINARTDGRTDESNNKLSKLSLERAGMIKLLAVYQAML